MSVHQQCAALPYVVVPGGVLVLLVTSRETRRWVIPKGWPKAGRAAHETAALEAKQEAGVVGEIAEKALGWYSYTKRLHHFSSVLCRVDVYPLAVAEQRLTWRERAQRQLVWLPPQEAAGRVEEPELSQMIAAFAG